MNGRGGSITVLKRGLFVLTALLLVIGLAACGGNGEQPEPSEGAGQEGADQSAGSGDQVTLKLGHLTPETTNYHQLALKVKELVEERTNGQYTFEIYPNRQLGADRELLEAMQFGNVDFAIISSPPISGFTPEFMVLDLPFLFESWDHVENFIGSDVYRELLSKTENAGHVTFELMARGYRHVHTNDKPIQSPEDFKGLNLRVIEAPMYVQAYEALGANVQAMSWPDAFTALEQGAIDGAENTLDIIHDERVYEVNNTVSKTGITFTFAAFMASKQTFEQLPEDVQQIIAEAVEEAVQEINAQNRQNDEEFEAKLEEKGMTIYEVDREPFKEYVQEVYDNYISQHGDELVNGIMELK